MMAEANDRLPHAVQDLPSRRQKGLKIERLLDLSTRGGHIRMLEVGTGTGGVAHYFATHPELDCSVDAVDVVDGRRITEDYSFHLVHGTQLPFADDRSEEHTSELQSLMRISYAVFCLKKKTTNNNRKSHN